MSFPVIPAGTLKEGVGQIIEDDLLFQVEQAALPGLQVILDLFLVSKQQVGGLIDPVLRKR